MSLHFKGASLFADNGGTQDCPSFNLFVFIKTSSHNILITL